MRCQRCADKITPRDAEKIREKGGRLVVVCLTCWSGVLPAQYTWRRHADRRGPYGGTRR